MSSLVILDILGVFGSFRIFNEYFLNFDHFGWGYLGCLGFFMNIFSILIILGVF